MKLPYAALSVSGTVSLLGSDFLRLCVIRKAYSEGHRVFWQRTASFALSPSELGLLRHAAIVSLSANPESTCAPNQSSHSDLYCMEAVIMLVLSRDCDSAVHIGSDITVKVLSIRRRDVRLGIEAPKNVRVWRSELVPKLEEEPSPTEEVDETYHAKRILLADDDAGHVTLIRRALRRSNIDCALDVVANGVEAIDYLFGAGQYADRKSAVMPDLVLLDLNMPVMNGRQVLQILRNARSQDRRSLPPVVVLTSSDEEVDIRDAYQLGAQSFIRKPVDHAHFAQAVQQTTSYWLGLNQSLSRGHSHTQRMKLPR